MIVYRVQHHPSRSKELLRLLGSLDVAPQVILDPRPQSKPSAWRTYKLCLADLPQGATHVLVIQDDTVAVPNLTLAVEAAAAERPDDLVAFFHGPQPLEIKPQLWGTYQAALPFWQVPKGRWIPTVALLWPVAAANDFLHWAEEIKHVPPDWNGDDNLVGEWAGKMRVRCSVTVPSLVEHPDDTYSLCKVQEMRGRRRAVLLAENATEWVDLL